MRLYRLVPLRAELEVLFFYAVDSSLHQFLNFSNASMNAGMAGWAERHRIVGVIRSSVSQPSNVVDIGRDKLVTVLAIGNLASVPGALKGCAPHSAKTLDLLGNALPLLWVQNTERAGFNRNTDILDLSFTAPSQFIAVA